MKMVIKTGDNVVVISGKEKGKSGKVLEVHPETNRVVVEGINTVKKHQKPRSQQDKGGIISKLAPMDASNVMVVCPTCGKATRVAHMTIEGDKVRSCKKCKGSLDKKYVKQAKKEAKKVVKEDAKKEVKAVKAEAPKAEVKKAAPKTEEKSVAKTAPKSAPKAEAKTTAKAETKKAAPKTTTQKSTKKEATK